MKYDCDIILDLLPLYAGKRLRKKSLIAVEEHLSECASCRAALADNIYNDSFGEVQQTAAVYKKRKKSRVLVRLLVFLLFVGALLAGLACLSYVSYGSFNFIQTAQALIEHALGA